MGFYIGGSQQCVQGLLDFDGVETESHASGGSGGHLGELVGPLIPIDAGAPKSSKVALRLQTWLIRIT